MHSEIWGLFCIALKLMPIILLYTDASIALDSINNQKFSHHKLTNHKEGGGGGDLFEDYKTFHLCRTLFCFTTNINRIYLHENITDLELFNARCKERP